MLTDGERVVVVSVFRAARVERNFDLLEGTEDDEVEVESGFMLDTENDGRVEAELEGDDAPTECDGSGDDGPCARLPVDCLMEDTTKATSSISNIPPGQSL